LNDSDAASVKPKWKAALFDWSGTLVDDLNVVWATNDSTLMSFGLRHQELETFKARFFLPWQEFYASYGLGSPQALEEVDRRFWRTYHTLSSRIKPFRQTRTALKELKAHGFKVAVVTQTKRGPLAEQIRRFGLGRLIDAAVGAEDAEELKPSPKPIQAALQKLKVRPEEAVFTGDMAEDVLSGKRAGVTVVSLMWKGSYHTEERVRKHSPDFVAHSLKEVVNMLLQGGPVNPDTR
jgi:phosphoglycolate phosphatase